MHVPPLAYAIHYSPLLAIHAHCHSHTYLPPILSPKVLISSLLSHSLALRIWARNTVYSAKTTSPYYHIFTSSHIAQCLLMVHIWCQHHGHNLLGLFFSLWSVPGQHKTWTTTNYTGLQDLTPPLPKKKSSLFSLTIYSFHCLFVPWVYARQSKPLNCHQQLCLQLWDDPMPKLSVIQALVACPRPDQRWLFLDSSCTLSLETYQLI